MPQRCEHRSLHATRFADPTHHDVADKKVPGRNGRTPRAKPPHPAPTTDTHNRCRRTVHEKHRKHTKRLWKITATISFFAF